MANDDFCVERRVCVDMSKIRATKKNSRGVEPQTVNLVQGISVFALSFPKFCVTVKRFAVGRCAVSKVFSQNG